MCTVVTNRCTLVPEVFLDFPAHKPYRLLEFILATTYCRHKLFIDRAPESFPLQNAFFIILSHNPNCKSKAASVRILPADSE